MDRISKPRRIEYHFERLISPFVAAIGYGVTVEGVVETVQNHATFTSVSRIAGGVGLMVLGGLEMRKERQTSMMLQHEAQQERRGRAACEIAARPRIYDFLADENWPVLE